MLQVVKGPPDSEPIGVQLTRTARVAGRAFDETLAAMGGSLGTWLVLMSLQGRVPGAQRELAAAVGIEGPTLTHHLNRMERAGLVTRRRDPENRRAHLVEMTEEGRTLFTQLLGEVIEFDARLRAGFTADEIERLRGYLDRILANVANAANATPAPAEPTTEGLIP
jgi:MarR family transcriptional regulator, transcriptional regulator for hemolysin